jgi:hypothetical protein
VASRHTITARRHRGESPGAVGICSRNTLICPLIPEICMPRKQSSSKLSTLALKVLSGETVRESKKLAASVLSQDEKKGQRK